MARKNDVDVYLSDRADLLKQDEVVSKVNLLADIVDAKDIKVNSNSEFRIKPEWDDRYRTVNSIKLNVYPVKVYMIKDFKDNYLKDDQIISGIHSYKPEYLSSYFTLKRMNLIVRDTKVYTDDVESNIRNFTEFNTGVELGNIPGLVFVSNESDLIAEYVTGGSVTDEIKTDINQGKLKELEAYSEQDSKSLYYNLKELILKSAKKISKYPNLEEELKNKLDSILAKSDIIDEGLSKEDELKESLMKMSNEEKYEFFSEKVIEDIDISDIDAMSKILEYASELEVHAYDIATVYGRTKLTEEDEIIDVNFKDMVSNLVGKTEKKSSLLSFFKEGEEEVSYSQREIVENFKVYCESKDKIAREKILVLDYLLKSIKLYISRADQYIKKMGQKIEELRNANSSLDSMEDQMSETFINALEIKISNMQHNNIDMTNNYKKIIVVLKDYVVKLGVLEKSQLMIPGMQIDVCISEDIERNEKFESNLKYIIDTSNAVSLDNNRKIATSISNLNSNFVPEDIEDIKAKLVDKENINESKPSIRTRVRPE